MCNPNYRGVTDVCVFICTVVCHLYVRVSSASVRENSEFTTFTGAACGDKANKRVEWKGTN